MKLRTSVFDSRSEERLFQTLDSQWSKNLYVYPQLPFSKLVDVDPDSLTKGQRDYFYKTNVDFTLCDKENKPILAIEFDGIGGGFNRSGEYLPARETEDPHRKPKLDFKLRIAQEVGLLLFVISKEEKDPIGAGESLAIVDSIIGQVLAKRKVSEQLSARIDEALPLVERWGEHEKHEYLQDVLLGLEVESALNWDPIAKLASVFAVRCTEYGVTKHHNEFLSDPRLPDVMDMFYADGVIARIKAMKNAVRVGCRVVVDTPRVPVVSTVWVRNFQGSSIDPSTISENIAEYLAFKRTYEILKTYGGGNK